MTKRRSVTVIALFALLVAVSATAFAAAVKCQQTNGLPVALASGILGSNDFTTCGLTSKGVTFDCSSGEKVAT